MKRCCSAVIVAAGESARMGMGTSKQFLPLMGIPAIAHTLKAFEVAPPIDQVVIVCREQDVPEMKRCVKEFCFSKVNAVVPGGETRQKSVAAGVKAAGNADFLAIHDGARALITPLEIMKVMEDAFVYGASALAVPVKDTVKVVGKDGLITATPDRSTLWAVQTPQVFSREIYQEAMAAAEKSGADYTDDCQMVERIGRAVHICQGAYSNIKLTTKEDLPTAEAILKARKGMGL